MFHNCSFLNNLLLCGPNVCGADSFKSLKFDCKFQHFAVIIRNVTAKC